MLPRNVDTLAVTVQARVIDPIHHEASRKYNLYMTILEAYMADFDSYEDVLNGGMNGKVFVTTAPNCTKGTVLCQKH